MMMLGGLLVLMLSVFVLRLSYTIAINLVKGRKFHHSLERDFDRLRLSNMLAAVGINKTAYIYQTNVNDIHRHMDNCSACKNTDECDTNLAKSGLDLDEIEFCNNEAELKKIKQQQLQSD